MTRAKSKLFPTPPGKPYIVWRQRTPRFAGTDRNGTDWFDVQLARVMEVRATSPGDAIARAKAAGVPSPLVQSLESWQAAEEARQLIARAQQGAFHAYPR